MTLPVPKFAVGDIVYHAGTTTETKRHPCPDCLGKGTWHVRSPAGGVYEAPCPRCSGSYQSNSDLNLNYVAGAPLVSRRTIGSVRIDTERPDPVSYMCIETGVGSGNVYDENTLFDTEEEALQVATLKASKMSVEVPFLKERYDQSVKFCDYELRPAVAEAEKAKNAILQWEFKDLLDDIEGCENMNEVKEVIERARS